MSYEASAIKDRLAAMEKSVEVERALARDADNARSRLEEELASAERARHELEVRFEKVNSERTEVITALEEVIHEVQSREEEIESLAHILRKRDEELEHAKMIATKALASAQELKTRYRERGSDRQSELNGKVSELNQNLEFLTSKNDELQRRTSRLEEQLNAREAECSELKARLGKQNVAARRPTKIEGNFISLSNQQPSQYLSPSGSDTGESLSDAASVEFNDAESTDMASSPAWLQNFDSGSTDSGDGVRTEPADLSRRSIERDALRKYVRKRYLKSKGSC
jgi:DNA repair exonuclease SbcCD ATPase subunit